MNSKPDLQQPKTQRFELSQIYVHHVGLSAAGHDLLKDALVGEPLKKIRGNAVRGVRRYSSRKNGNTIQAENATILGAIIEHYELASDVDRYLDYAAEIHLDYVSAKKKRIVEQHIPRFLVVRKGSVGFEEWVSDKDLAHRAESDPENFFIDENQVWHFLPHEQAAKKLGFYYRVHPYSSLEPIYVANLEYEFDYLTADPATLPDLSTEPVLQLVSFVEQNQSITLDELFDEINRLKLTPNHFYALIITKQLYYDRNAVAIWAREAVRVFTSEDYARAFKQPQYTGSENLGVHVNTVSLESGIELLWQGETWIFLNQNDSHVNLKAPSGTIVPLLRDQFDKLINQGDIKSSHLDQANDGSPRISYEAILKATSSRQITEALGRLNTIQGESIAKTLSTRTKRQWQKQFNDAEKRDGYGFVGLIDKTKNRGNREPRFPKQTLDIMNEQLSLYASTHRFSISATWGAIEKACKEANVPYPSYESIRKLIRKGDFHKQEKAQWGPKAAYDSKPTHWHLNAEHPRDGNRPLHIAHVDHWNAPVTLIDSKTGEVLGKCWVSVMIDAYTREVLAFYLSYEEASYRSTLMLIRECVRRHHCLPTWIVMDQGSDFNSIYVEQILALCGSHKHSRPAGQPHNGSPIERIFETTEEAWVAGLQGSTKPRENPRTMSPSVDPDAHAVWTLVKFYRRAAEFFYDRYNNTGHSSLGNASPYAMRAHGLRFSGDRVVLRRIDYDAGFIFATLPSTDKGTAKVMSARGIKVKNDLYWHPIMRFGDVIGTDVEVRYEPFDRSIAFAFIKGEWRLCWSRDANLRGVPERLVQLQSEEANARDKAANKGSTRGKRAQENAEFRLSLLEEEGEMSERLRIERLKQAESRTVREIMGLDTLSTLRSTGYELPDQTSSPAIPTVPELAPVLDVSTKQKLHYVPRSVQKLELNDD